jgi:hypothetical protein
VFSILQSRPLSSYSYSSSENASPLYDRSHLTCIISRTGRSDVKLPTRRCRPCALCQCMPTMKYDGNKTDARMYFVFARMIVGGPHPDRTYDVAHASSGTPKDASEFFSHYHQDLGGPIRVHGDYIVPHDEGRPMDLAAFRKFQTDRGNLNNIVF